MSSAGKRSVVSYPCVICCKPTARFVLHLVESNFHLTLVRFALLDGVLGWLHNYVATIATAISLCFICC
jgi:hypothetical protein